MMRVIRAFDAATRRAMLPEAASAQQRDAVAMPRADVFRAPRQNDADVRRARCRRKRAEARDAAYTRHAARATRYCAMLPEACCNAAVRRLMKHFAANSAPIRAATPLRHALRQYAAFTLPFDDAAVIFRPHAQRAFDAASAASNHARLILLFWLPVWRPSRRCRFFLLSRLLLMARHRSTSVTDTIYAIGV